MPRARLVLAVALAVLAGALAGAGAVPAAVDPAWLQRTLAFESRLGDGLALENAFWIGTRDSALQRLSVTAQLDLGVRSLELDLHYVYTPRVGGGKGVVVCRSTCDGAPLLVTPLSELRRWLRDHPTEVVLLVVGDELGDADGQEAAARVFATELGTRLYRPAPRGACAPMPLDVQRKEVRADGAQVVVVSGCGPEGTAWRGVAFDDADLVANQRDAAGFHVYPRCDGFRSRADYAAHVIRYVDDGRLTAGIARAMVRCGVDVVALDRLRRDDPRLEALSWSWAPGQPLVQAGGTCAVQRADGRWVTDGCTARHAFACHRPGDGWTVDRRRAAYRRGARRCPGGARFDVPRSGREAQLLRTAMRRAGVRRAWVAYRRGTSR